MLVELAVSQGSTALSLPLPFDFAGKVSLNLSGEYVVDPGGPPVCAFLPFCADCILLAALRAALLLLADSDSGVGEGRCFFRLSIATSK